MQTQALVLRETGGIFRLEELEMDGPRAGEVLVRIAGVGLCHTDLVFRDGLGESGLPAVLGHEGAGTIEALGDEVEGLAVGDKVCPRLFQLRHLPTMRRTPA